MKKIILIIVTTTVCSFSDSIEPKPLSDPTPSENEKEEPEAHLKDIKKMNDPTYNVK